MPSALLCMHPKSQPSWSLPSADSAEQLCESKGLEGGRLRLGAEQKRKQG